MKTFRNKIDNFFKWVKGTELVELTNIDVSEDPVRPELDLDWRLSAERKIYGLSYENDIEAIVCVAYTNEVPTTVKELEYMSQVACQDNQYIKRLITLSPLTPMATHFHMKNGAKLISINTTTQNFEYEWLVH